MDISADISNIRMNVTAWMYQAQGKETHIMGMSASQARMLTITARLSDLELSAQAISNSKIRLSVKSEDVAKAYSEALNNKKLVYQNTTEKVTAQSLTGYRENSAQMLLRTAGGQLVVSSLESQAYAADPGNEEAFLSELSIVTDPGAENYDAGKLAHYKNVFAQMSAPSGYTTLGDNFTDTDYLYNELQNGNLYIEKYKPSINGGEGGFQSISFDSEPVLQEVYDTSDDAAAEAKYATEMASIQTKDKQFDLDLKNIDTEHNALQTEIDSVKKVVDKNIERSFKIFG